MNDDWNDITVVPPPEDDTEVIVYSPGYLYGAELDKMRPPIMAIANSGCWNNEVVCRQSDGQEVDRSGWVFDLCDGEYKVFNVTLWMHCPKLPNDK